MNFVSRHTFRMPSFSQEIKVDLNSNEKGDLKSDTKDERNEERNITMEPVPNNAPPGLNADQQLAFALRDFLGPPGSVLGDNEPSPSSLGQTLPFIDEHADSGEATQSDEDQTQRRGTEEALNNAACRLRRWRAASRKLRRPRIIDNLCNGNEKDSNGKACNGGHTDLADRLRSLAAAGSMSASAGELLSLAPPPPAATAPPSPSCLFSPSLADQSSAEYFVSTSSSLEMYIS